jgi:hypothetical protein
MLGAVFGAVAFTSNGLGMLLGGLGSDRLSRVDARWPLWGPALMLALASPFYFAAFWIPSLAVSLTCIWIANLSLATYLAPSMATMQNLAGPRMRALAWGIVAMVSGLLGAGMGPTLLGIASDQFAQRAFGAGDFIATCPGGRAPADSAGSLDAACQAASTQGLRLALVCGLVFLLWAAVHYLLASRTLKRDLFAPARAG